MSRLSHTASLEVRTQKGNPVLAVRTGHPADSLESLRLVKSSRGSGWLWRNGRLEPWETRGVLQDGQLVIWGETAHDLEGLVASEWVLDGKEAWQLQVSLVKAWTTLARQGALPAKFNPSTVLLARDGLDWAVAFLPDDLASVLTSVLPLRCREDWEPFLLPDSGQRSWPFSSMAFLWRAVETVLPWQQGDESFLRQEIRDLAKSLEGTELPVGLDSSTRELWLASAGRQEKNQSPDWSARWSEWATTHEQMPAIEEREALASQNLLQGREFRSFWRRRGTLVLFIGASVLAALLVAGSIVWNIVKPDLSDHWTPREVAQGYYQALDELQGTELRKLLSKNPEGGTALGQDDEQTTNLFVLVQVRTAYERQSPLLKASDWIAKGRPALDSGQLLYGLSGLKIQQGAIPEQLVADYTKWVSVAPAEAGASVNALGEIFQDVIRFQKTWKGWKIADIQRSIRPLP